MRKGREMKEGDSDFERCEKEANQQLNYVGLSSISQKNEKFPNVA
jgi:hypothetical protein